ncbi:MAG: carbamoyltransferase HypF [candidate division KSB1 bacterium]|nr:carbamoyltransferase HypF [candidate division KSB1 bacterium]MDZ7274111.1 carbamoyltransferase HypF [candidate division KSB1 bacterium]MDZ7287845.1 carbamoyltransferase HypF [candidate division KSB1 bacterium]MDZ7296709.1 carbamoyltransferase HypF [candidate division KSB1 bacterium]MDZ7309571.1 carbamoyltransferase HypF [candidate division KSB1 bacterium]
MLRRERIHISGIVQGVGFRPFVYRLAQQCGLGGFVSNNTEGVLIEAEGAAAALQEFRARLAREAPPAARIVRLEVAEIAPAGEVDFKIVASRRDRPAQAFISPDLALCADCRAELFDPQNRRFHYPFINCTNCGPRYTIVRGIPYDRPNTSMSVFAMCAACAAEYHDPANRRFHAQPNACPQCGPRLWLCDRHGTRLAEAGALAQAVVQLQQGAIVAIRGLGGFHLAVDARNESAVQALRRRKGRAEKPFAMMARDLATLEKFCFVSPLEQAMLQQPTRPIVLLRRRDCNQLAAAVAPHQKYFGFMLPYTPLHELLLHDHFEALVMTSGNFSEEPIAISNEEALARLAALADFFLLHDREILQRCDDSIVRCAAGRPRLLRRARGHVPQPVFLPRATRRRVLACGGELKNTIALSRGNAVFLSQHIGDLDNPAAFAFFENSIAHLQRILEIVPELIAYDLHPEYLSTKWAVQQEHLPRVGVQHHHAHLAAVMADNGVTEKTIGLILDGTGYGSDGTIWGGEVLIGDAAACQRFAYLQPVVMPGGTAAIRQPWRMALSYLAATFGSNLGQLSLPFLQQLRGEAVQVVLQMIDKNINSPLTSSCGRLFDGVAALLGLRQEVNYEAQAAIELEMLADEGQQDFYSDAVRSAGAGALPLTPVVAAVVEELQNHVPREKIAARFHHTMAELFVRAACAARELTGIARVGLSGGVYQNTLFFHRMTARLQAEGFEVLSHQQVPTNDGGLALGQVVIADALAGQN